MSSWEATWYEWDANEEFSLIDWVTINLLNGSYRTLTLTSTRGNRMNLMSTLMWLSEFFNRWLVVDVPPGWQLVSQVLLALLITPLWAEIIGRVGRVLFCQGALFFSPRTMSPTSGLRGFWPHTRSLSLYLMHAITSTVDVTLPSFYQSPLFLWFSLAACFNTDRFH